MGGRFRRLHRLEVAYFAQHQLDELKPAWSPYDHVRALMPDATEAQVRARTGALGFVRAKMDTKAADLSGGEKARLLLGLATFTGANLMILDEPTNHLDIDSREALVHLVAGHVEQPFRGLGVQGAHDIGDLGRALGQQAHDLALARLAVRDVLLEHGRRVLHDVARGRGRCATPA